MTLLVTYARAVAMSIASIVTDKAKTLVLICQIVAYGQNQALERWFKRLIN
ncbi:hypothetical protein SDC9_206597 [bioreactor metagenome]|uniref:Uncharacterized protein n=1 Tax=bioreactor metagenome TaxID=1076179 RepID=A0A645J5I1_9ZZZZ